MILKKLISTLKDSVFSPVYHLAAEYIEIGIDEVLENNVLQEIPVMNTISTAEFGSLFQRYSGSVPYSSFTYL